MRRLVHMIIKEFGQIRRDRRMIPMFFVAPVLQLVLLGYAANVDVKLVDTAVYDLDRSAESREVVRVLEGSGYFEIVESLKSYDEGEKSVDEGEAKMAIVFPRDFGKKLKDGERSPIQVLVDGSDSNAAVIGLNYLGSALREYSNKLALERLNRDGVRQIPAARVGLEPRIWYNPQLKSMYFMIPGVLCILLMVTTMMTTSMGVVREKELGTMEQLIVTPIRPWELIVGKLFPFAIIGFLETAFALAASALVFHVPIRSNIFLIFFAAGLFLLTTLGLGLFVSTVSNTQQQAMMTAGFFIMMPFMMLSGFIFPIENMPGVIQAATYLIPLRYFLVILRALFLKGVGLAVLWKNALALFVWGVSILALSILRFHKRL